VILHFNGKPVEARAGDTVASAMYRSGQRIFSRSFKFHRPRGLLCANGKCPNCLMNVDGAPNIRACVTPAREGMQVEHQNAWPSLELDYLSFGQHFDWLMPVGWYYKMFTNPRSWHAAEPYIRKAAGLGRAPEPGYPDREYEHSHRQAEVAVIGGGPSGMAAAIEAGGRGEQVILVDDQAALGGHLRYRKSGTDSADALVARLREIPSVEVIQPAYCFGLYEDGLLGVLQTDPHAGAAERLIHLRARRVVVATGVYEAPLTFVKNDLPGVMLSSAAERLIHLHGVTPGRSAVVVGEGPRAAEVAAVLRAAGVEVAGTVSAVVGVAALGTSCVTGL